MVHRELHLLSSFLRILFLFVSFYAIFARAGMVESAVGAVGEITLKQTFMMMGKSNSEADCIVEVMNWQGAKDDFTDIGNYLQPDEFERKLNKKSKLGQLVCSDAGAFIIAILFFVAVISMCCCCIRMCCCRSSRKVGIVYAQPASGYPGIPFQKV